jgi:hypothetical protein
MEGDGAIHIADELDDIGELHGKAPPSGREDTATKPVRETLMGDAAPG